MRRSLSVLCTIFPLAWATVLRADPGDEVLTKTGTTGGLIVHVGCGDGQLTAKLRTAQGALVHGLDTNWSNIAKARQHIHSTGQYGRVAVSHFDGRSLPYCDNLVNLIVADELGAVPMAEVTRVLAPLGVAYVGGKKTVKPWPKEIDEWTHFLHGPDNNAVARDTRAGAPRHMQWLADPMWSRNHHKLASISSVVSSGGRLFYIVDDSTGASMKVPGQWSVTARDAFNGVRLWKRSLPDWAWTGHKFRSGPVQLPRTLVAEGGRVYLPLRGGAPVSVLDAVTGDVVRTYDATKGAEEIVLYNDVLYVVTGSPTAEQALIGPKRGAKIPAKTVVAVDAASGDVLWRWSDGERGALLPMTLAVSGGSVFLATGQGVAALAADSGAERWFADAAYLEGAGNPKRITHDARYERMPEWMSPQPGSVGSARGLGWSLATLVVRDEVVLWAGTHRLRALAAKDGKRLWEALCRPGYCKSPVDVLAVDGTVWVGPDFNKGRDLRTGEVTRENAVFEDLWTAGHHHRCYRNKATSRYIMTGHRGVELMALQGEDHGRNNWTRGICQYGIMPCNGLLYVPTHICACYIEAQLNGFWAFASELASPIPPPAAPALDKGPAYASPIRQSAIDIRQSADWPTHRGNAARTACTDTAVPPGLSQAWRTELTGPLSGVTVAGRRVFVATVDSHQVRALDAQSGETQWRFTAGGRIDSPPTIHGGRAYFGSNDGWVYCLRASDGALAWRYRVAPAARYTVARDGVESLWPVHGSVLIQNDTVYAVAGRSSYLDGGLRFVGLDPETGAVRHETVFASKHPDYASMMAAKETASKEHPLTHTTAQFATDWKTFTDPDKSDSFTMEGAIDDILVGDSSQVYMKHLCFDDALVRQERVGRHLFSTTRLLDDAEHHRTFMMLGTANIKRAHVSYSWIANRRHGARGYFFDVPYGLLLACDETTAYGIWSGYQVFAETIRPQPQDGPTRSDIQTTPERKGKAKPELHTMRWQTKLAFRPRAMLRTKDVLFIGGMDGTRGPEDLVEAYEGRKGGVLCAVSVADGKVLAEHKIPSPPVWDGMAAARGRLYLATEEGAVYCFAAADEARPGGQ